MKLINVKFSEFQKDKLRRAYNKRENISLKLVYDPHGDRIYVNDRQYNKLMKGKPVIINFNDTHFRVMKKDGGSLLSSLIGPITKVATKLAPALTKTVLPGLATGVASALGSLGIDSLFNGKGIDGKTSDLIKGLAVIENELKKLNKPQKDKFDEIMMTGNGQSGGFLSTLLMSLGLPLVIKALTGSGIHNRPYDINSYKTHPKKIPIPTQNQPAVKQPEGTSLREWELFNPPPFNDDHKIIENKGRGIKKKIKKITRPRDHIRREITIPQRASAKYPLLKFKDDSTSDIYLQQWIDHMHIRNFGGVYAKDQLTKNMIKKDHFYIINLDNFNSLITNGTHWTVFYYYRNRIEYFDSFGLKPPQIISQNYKYIYNTSQLQSYNSMACGYYCLYFIYHRYNGMSFYQIIKRFNLVNIIYNQNLIKDFFNNYN